MAAEREHRVFADLHTLRPIDDYHEDMGPMLWWHLPIVEAPYVGSPLDSDWPDYHTHFSALPDPARFTVAPSRQTETHWMGRPSSSLTRSELVDAVIRLSAPYRSLTGSDVPRSLTGSNAP